MLQRAKGNSRPSADSCTCYSSQYHGYYTIAAADLNALEIADAVVELLYARSSQPCIDGSSKAATTEVHTDALLSIWTVLGSKGVLGPLNLWLFWPSTELHHLAKCESRTENAIDKMDYPSSAVQMPGETIIVPPTSPHAVIALNSSYLHGSIIRTPKTAFDRSAVHMKAIDFQDSDSSDTPAACAARSSIGTQSTRCSGGVPSTLERKLRGLKPKGVSKQNLLPGEDPLARTMAGSSQTSLPATSAPVANATVASPISTSSIMNRPRILSELRS